MRSPERLVFQQSFEGLFRALGNPMDARCAERLRELGLDANARLAVAYPLEVWIEALRTAAETLAPGAPLDDAAAVVGRRFIEGYGSTYMGAALLRTVRMLGPRRMLERMTRNLRTGTNYLESTLRERGPTHYELTCRPVLIPGFYQGLLSAGLEISGAYKPSVQMLRLQGDEAVYELTWS